MFIATELYDTFGRFETEKNYVLKNGDLVGDFTKKLVIKMDGTPYMIFTWMDIKCSLTAILEDHDWMQFALRDIVSYKPEIVFNYID